MNRLIPRSWGENLMNIFLDLSKYIAHFSSSTCVDRQFLVRRNPTPWLPFPPLPGGTGCGLSHSPFLTSLASFSNPSSTISPGRSATTTPSIRPVAMPRTTHSTQPSPAQTYAPDNPFNPANRYDPGNPVNPANRYNPNTPFDPLNRTR